MTKSKSNYGESIEDSELFSEIEALLSEKHSHSVISKKLGCSRDIILKVSKVMSNEDAELSKIAKSRMGGDNLEVSIEDL